MAKSQTQKTRKARRNAVSRSLARLVRPLNRRQQEALSRFGETFDYCPCGVHIKTLMFLIERELVVFKERLPWIPGLTENRWKGNFHFALAGGGRKNTYLRKWPNEKLSHAAESERGKQE